MIDPADVIANSLVSEHRANELTSVFPTAKA